MVAGIEAAVPGGHHAAAPGADRLDDRLPAIAVEPDPIGEVGRAQLVIALAVVAVAARALLGK